MRARARIGGPEAVYAACPCSLAIGLVLHLRLGAASVGLGRLRSLPRPRAGARARRAVSDDGSAVGLRLLSRRHSIALFGDHPWIPLRRAGAAERDCCRWLVFAFARTWFDRAHRRRRGGADRRRSRSTPSTRRRNRPTRSAPCCSWRRSWRSSARRRRERLALVRAGRPAGRYRARSSVRICCSCRCCWPAYCVFAPPRAPARVGARARLLLACAATGR